LHFTQRTVPFGLMSSIAAASRGVLLLPLAGAGEAADLDRSGVGVVSTEGGGNDVDASETVASLGAAIAGVSVGGGGDAVVAAPAGAGAASTGRPVTAAIAAGMSRSGRPPTSASSRRPSAAGAGDTGAGESAPSSRRPPLDGALDGAPDGVASSIAVADLARTLVPHKNWRLFRALQ